MSHELMIVSIRLSKNSKVTLVGVPRRYCWIEFPASNLRKVPAFEILKLGSRAMLDGLILVAI